MRTAGFALSAVLGLGAIVLAFALLAPSEAFSRLVVNLVDECDPTTFNAAGVPGGCTRTEGKPFREFIAEVNEDHAVGGWEFDPDSTGIKAGDAVSAFNRGGEVHTFTKVARFGNGFVPVLNDPAQATALECKSPSVAMGTFVPQGGSTGPVVLPPGRHRFQCCIHPWMRTTIQVEAH